MVYATPLDSALDEVEASRKRIRTMIDRLYEVHESHDREAAVLVLDEVIDGILYDFADGELQMIEAGYELYPVHKAHHQAFVDCLARIRERFDDGENVAYELILMLSGWLTEHVYSDDFMCLMSIRPDARPIGQTNQISGLRTQAPRRIRRKPSQPSHG